MLKTYCKTIFSLIFLFLLLCTLMNVPSHAQDKSNFVLENGQIKYSDMNSWWSRTFKESGLLGGKMVHYYEPGPDDEQFQNIEGTIPDHTPWASSNVKAKVGVTAGNRSVFREPRGDGYCARLETYIKSVYVLGIVNVKAIATGSLFLGEIIDPITDPKNPRHNTWSGIEFSGKPDALKFDYKVSVGEERKVATGGLRVKDVAGRDSAEVYILLQNRMEDADGNLIVRRIGTGWIRFGDNIDKWVNGYTLPIQYGDITKKEGFKPFMGLINEKDPYYAKNSKGEPVSYIESGWGNKEDEVTHLIISISSSYEGGAFTGSPDSKLWIDNLELVYPVSDNDISIQQKE